MNKAFAPLSAAAVSISATSSSASAALSPNDTQGPKALRVVVLGTGASAVFIAWGAGSATATTASIPMLANTVETFTIPGTATHIAAITASGTATVYVHVGEGV